jgi:hypothetical protein
VYNIKLLVLKERPGEKIHCIQYRTVDKGKEGRLNCQLIYKSTRLSPLNFFFEVTKKDTIRYLFRSNSVKKTRIVSFQRTSRNEDALLPYLVTKSLIDTRDEAGGGG